MIRTPPSVTTRSDVVRKRCADSSSAAGEVIERLETAKGHLSWRQHIEAFSLAAHPTVAELRAPVEGPDTWQLARAAVPGASRRGSGTPRRLLAESSLFMELSPR